MTIEEVKHPDLQKAVKDIAAVLDIKQNHVAGRQVLIDFIVNTIGGCIGPNPDNPEEQIWVDDRAGNLKPETLATYEALATPAAEADIGKETEPAPKVEINENGDDVIIQDGAEAGPAEKAETEVVGEEAGAAQPKECPEFGKGYDPADPACAKPCKRDEECQTVMAEAKAAAPTGRKPRKTAEEKEAEKQAKAAEREAKKQERATRPKPQAEKKIKYNRAAACVDALKQACPATFDEVAAKAQELYLAVGNSGGEEAGKTWLKAYAIEVLSYAGLVSESEGKLHWHGSQG